jgi:hypothetical protein
VAEIGCFSIFSTERLPEGAAFGDGTVITGDALVLNMQVTDFDGNGVYPEVTLGDSPQRCTGSADCPAGSFRLARPVRPVFTINTDGNPCGSQPEKTECNVVFQPDSDVPTEQLRLVPFGEPYAPKELIFRLPPE